MVELVVGAWQSGCCCDTYATYVLWIAMVKAGQTCGMWCVSMLIHTTLNPYQWIDDRA